MATDPLPPIIDGETVFGDDGNNYLLGTFQNDRIYGLGGNDHIVFGVDGYGQGNTGQDVVTGGAGWDRFSGLIWNLDGDWITDFGVDGDRISVRFAQLGDADLNAILGTETTTLEFDEDSDGILDGYLVLEGLYPGSFTTKPSTVFPGGTDIGYSGEIISPPPSTDPLPPSINGITLTGSPENDYLPGSRRNDQIDGKSGNDHLIGKAGADIMTGGLGWDRFSGTLSELDGDWLTDFGVGGDRITVRAASFDKGSLDTILGSATTTLVIDTNKDGKPESSLVLQGLYSGSFTTKPSTVFPGGTDIGYSGDLPPPEAKLDLFAVGTSAHSIFLNDGEGALVDTGQRLTDIWSTGVDWGDVDGDRDLDIIISNNSSSEPARIYLNDGVGFFALGEVLGLGGVNRQPLLADFDGDRDLDAFITQSDQSPSSVWFNDGNGHFTDSGQRFLNYHSVDAVDGDFDGDGDIDVFLTNDRYFEDPQIDPTRLYVNDGNGKFTDSGQVLGPFAVANVVAGDIDGDGDLDAIAHGDKRPTDYTRIFVNQGGEQGGVEGIFSDDRFIDTGVRERDVELGDIDNDGDLDLLVASFTTPNLVYFNQGGRQGGVEGEFANSGQAIADRGEKLRLTDLDGDGTLELFVTHPDADDDLSAGIWENDGTGRFFDTGVRLTGGGMADAAFADFGPPTDTAALLVSSIDNQMA